MSQTFLLRSSRFIQRVPLLTACLAAAIALLSLTGAGEAQKTEKGVYQPVSFKQLKRYLPGQPVPTEIAALNGKNVEVLGFMAALTQFEDIDEFVLSSAPPLNCFCAPPLFINEVISVKMNRKAVSYKAGVVKVKGKLIINTKIKDEFTDVMYTLKADGIE
jgi:hypothetical protein